MKRVYLSTVALGLAVILWTGGLRSRDEVSSLRAELDLLVQSLEHLQRTRVATPVEAPSASTGPATQAQASELTASPHVEPNSQADDVSVPRSSIEVVDLGRSSSRPRSKLDREVLQVPFVGRAPDLLGIVLTGRSRALLRFQGRSAWFDEGDICDGWEVVHLDPEVVWFLRVDMPSVVRKAL